VIVSIAQPAYLPWLGWFDRVSRSDLHVVLDTVKIDRSSRTKFANRNKVRTPDGWTWITVPLQTKGRGERLVLRDIETAVDGSWAERHWRTLQANYARAPYFAEHAPFFRVTYGRSWPRLVDLVREMNDYLLAAFAIHTPLVWSSDLEATGTKDELLVEICREVGATAYVSGPFGRDYIDQALFAAADIELQFHDYDHPTYEQAFTGFEPYMSAADLLFCHGALGLEILSTAAVLASR
jgi:hypothetical protein